MVTRTRLIVSRIRTLACLVLADGEWSTSRSGRITPLPGEGTPIPVEYEAVSAPETFQASRRRANSVDCYSARL